MRWSINQTSQPTYTPVTLEEARSHVRLFMDGSTHPDDDILESYIEAATAAAENFTQRAFAQRTYELKADALKERMCLPVYPILSVDAVKYLDSDGAEQTLSVSEYLVDTNVIPAVIEIDDVPVVKDQRNAVTIEVTAGYSSDNSPADPDLIPRTIKQAILLATGHFYENREDVVIGVSVARLPMAFEYLLWPHRVLGL